MNTGHSLHLDEEHDRLREHRQFFSKLHPYRRGSPTMHVPKLQHSSSLLFRIVLTVACLQGPSATLLVGQASDPVSEAEHLMKKGQPDKALELLNPLSATTPEPKGAEYLRGL